MFILLAIRPIDIILLVLAGIIIVLLGWLIIRTRWDNVHKYATLSTWMLDLLESMPDMVVIFNADQRVMEIINPNRSVLSEYAAEKIVGKQLKELETLDNVFQKPVEIISLHLQDTIVNKTTNDFELEINKDGQKFYSRARIAPFGKNDAIYYSYDVTTQVRAEKEIMRLKTFLQSVVDNLPVGILVKNASDEFRYYFRNAKLHEMYADREIKLGSNDFEANDPDPEESYQEDMLALKSNSPITFERIFYDEKTGKPIRWADATKTHFIDNEGNHFIIATIVDTTDIKKKQFELEAIRSYLSLALEVGNLGAGTYDVQTGKFNSFYKQLVAKEGMGYKEVMNIIHPNDKPLYIDMFDRLIAGKTDKERLRVRFLINGAYVWYDVYVMSLKDTEGNVYQLVGTEHNVNEEVKKQIELEEAKSKLELAFKSAEITPWEFDADSAVFSSFYPEVYESNGFTIKEYASCFAPEDASLFMTGMENLLTGKKTNMFLQTRITFPEENQQRWYEIHAVTSLWREDGTVARIIGLRRDITALKITNELIELRNKAEESNRLKSAFLANMSHEIRTPLNAIVGFSNLIMEYSEQNDELKEYFSIIERNNDLLLQLINDILDLSKIEAGQLDFHFSDFEVNAIFHNLKQVYETRLQPGVALVYELPEDHCMIHSELNRLTQVISNFVSNAVKFTSGGSITMGYAYIENGLRFYVRDTGKGIAPENIGSVFKRFAKFDSFVQGTGLGLSICETIIQYLGGEIGVESELGRGSEFWFTLPCKPELLPSSIPPVNNVEMI